MKDSAQTSGQRRIIGLTGGIATGKSTVSKYLETKHHLPVLDADVYARQAVEKGGTILAAIAHRYGSKILHLDGTLNRPALGNIIFNNPTEKKWLEQQIHPYVRTQFQKTTETFPLSQPLVYAIPLLFEANLTHLATEIWVVYCTPAQQQSRLISRNNLSVKEAHSRINSQLSLSEKCQKADHILDNTTTREKLFKQIDTLFSEKSESSQSAS